MMHKFFISVLNKQKLCYCKYFSSQQKQLLYDFKFIPKSNAIAKVATASATATTLRLRATIPIQQNIVPYSIRMNHNDSGETKTDREPEWKRKYGKLKVLTIAFIGIASGFKIFSYLDSVKALSKDKKDDDNFKSTEQIHITDNIPTDLPTYKMDEVRKHNSLETGVWITYKKGVYDVTKFVSEHPGGDNIMLGAGGAIDPFWHIYQQHNTEQVLKLLETFRIGNLSVEDDLGVDDLGSPWAAEPIRHPILKPASTRPFNAEPPASLLVENFITPIEFFYVRNHLPVPVIDEQSYELEIEIEDTDNQRVLKLSEIKQLPKHTITAAVMCGGNRRSEMNEVKEVKGLSWGPSAVGNAQWSGVLLKDLLKEMGVESDEKRHVIFEGFDLDPTSKPYGASIPLSKAMNERGDVLLAYEMNGKPLTRDHGYPLRVIVPGVVGARNVKWVGRIIVSEHESDSHWQQNDYKGFSPSVDWDTVDFTKSPAIQNMPVTSAICSPKTGDSIKIDDGFVNVKGYAWSGGGNRIVRVDLTIDGGNNWCVADLEQTDDSSERHWSWTLWKAKIPIKDVKEKNIEIWAKAVDSNYNCQPESFKNIWNLRGVLSNAYHRVKIKLI